MTRRILVCFLLLASLLVQAEAVFACVAMDSKVQSRCCCPTMTAPACDREADCASNQETTSGPCCTMSLRMMPRIVSDAVAPTPDSLLVPEPIRLLFVLLALTLVTRSAIGRSRPIHLSTHPDWLTGTDTFLITRRLRN